MTIVVDASVILALLLNEDADGDWVTRTLQSQQLVAPHHMSVEVVSALRRGVASGRVGPATGRLALAELLTIRVDLAPFAPFASRVWELRDAVSAYDAWYVAVAKLLDAPLVTLDRRLASAPGPRCRFVTP